MNNRIPASHPSVDCYLKHRVVTDNLYSVDMMEEASEISKLRLFPTMVSSVRQLQDLEQLPNIGFNILAGNSLVRLMRVDEHEFDALASEFSLRDHRDDVTESAERARLHAELDSLVADFHGLSEEEFAHILASLPLVPESVKQAAPKAYCDVVQGLIQ